MDLDAAADALAHGGAGAGTASARILAFRAKVGGRRGWRKG